MKKLGIVLLLSVMATSAFAATKVGVVDLQKVIQESAKAKAMNAAMLKKFKPARDALQANNEKWQADVKKYQRDMSVMTAKQKKDRQAALKKEQQTYLKKAEKFQTQYMAEQKKNVDNLQAAIKKALAAVAKKGDYSMILLKQAAPYVADDSMDVTEQVKQQLG